ncbi:hypothetical protein ACFQZJ_00850 [Maribacter chungangensis]|uniref:Deoxyuridine 5'-triphosphate nucleotidohydrolase n=1 Tax=Maribacter chungangensis TaxID=1069117 RepID=A0ABW3AZS9_9FLAO
MPFSKEFKEALSELPSKEKDKLLLRLLKKDLKLADRLFFELVDNRTVDERRAIMEQRVLEQTAYFTSRYYSPGYLMMDLRYLSGEITEHVTITKDKFGEVTLNLTMLTTVLDKTNAKIAGAGLQKSQKFCIYVIARTFKLLLLIAKMHEDYQLDFKPEIEQLGRLIGQNDLLMRMAIHHGLDVNWLTQFNIPKDIVEIHKDLRSRGYLK